MSGENEAIEAIIRQRFSVVLDSSSTVVSACAAWVGVYSAVAPALITKVWASLMTDANSDTDRRVGLLAVMHEALKTCARRGGADEVIRQFVLAARKDVPSAIRDAIPLEPEHSEFRQACLQALLLWRGFTGFFPLQWVDKTIGLLSQNAADLAAANASSANSANLSASAASSAMTPGLLGAKNNKRPGQDSDLLKSNNASGTNAQQQNQQQQQQGTTPGVSGTSSSATAAAAGGGGGGSSSTAAAGGSVISAGGVMVDSVAAESSGLAQVLRLFQKYNAAVERLRRFEADASASASIIESVRDDVVHRAKPLLNALGSSGGSFGFVPSIETEVRRIQEQQQQNTTSAEDAADPLEDFFV